MEVISPLEVIEYSFGGFSLGFWVGHLDEMDENSAKSRALIVKLMQVLARRSEPELDLPLPELDELVVEAPLVWNGHTFRLLFNTFDGVVAVDHKERQPLVDLLEFVSGDVFVMD